MKFDQPFRPAQHSERVIIESILNGTYPPGAFLPSERKLAETINVTRPTIRETLQRLSTEGWITIRHGKPTEVNNFWEKGGMRLLGTLVKYGGFLPESFILSLMEFRVILMPPVGRLAVENNPQMISEFLFKSKNIDDTADAFVTYDWHLQTMMAQLSGNSLFPLILNDFASIFQTLASAYFSLGIARNASMEYYDRLQDAICHDPSAVEQVVKNAMQKSIEIFKNLASSNA